MKNAKIVIVAICIALLSGLGGYQLQLHMNHEQAVDTNEVTNVKKAVSPEEIIGQQARPFVLRDVEGQERHSSEWQGKVVALNFWATWCPPCRDEIPHFVELQQHYANEGLQFVGVALQEADEVRDFLLEFNVNYPSLVGADDVLQLAKALGNGIGALPYTVIIDRQGNVAFTKRGALSKAEAESVIQGLL